MALVERSAHSIGTVALSYRLRMRNMSALSPPLSPALRLSCSPETKNMRTCSCIPYFRHFTYLYLFICIFWLANNFALFFVYPKCGQLLRFTIKKVYKFRFLLHGQKKWRRNETNQNCNFEKYSCSRLQGKRKDTSCLCSRRKVTDSPLARNVACSPRRSTPALWRVTSLRSLKKKSHPLFTSPFLSLEELKIPSTDYHMCNCL